MKKIIIISVLWVLIDLHSLFGQIKYYVATGKDSITYVATNVGLLVLTRDSNQELIYHSIISDSNKVYSKALDNDNFLIFGTDQSLDLYSLYNKYLPEYVGSLNISDIISIRPFGNFFAILRGTGWSGITDHYIVGLVQDTFRIVSVINSLFDHYTSRTEFYPEVVYPYFFSIDGDSSSNIIMYKFDRSAMNFEFIDAMSLVTPGWSFVQMYGGKDRFYIREREGNYMQYTVNAKKYYVNDDTLHFLAQHIYNIVCGFTDEIECTDTLIRLNGSYTYLNGQYLTEPNEYLFSGANLSGIRIYSTVQWGVPSNTKMYYSTDISGTTINSAQFIYDPNEVEESSNRTDFILYENYPNPFNPSTNISFNLPGKSDVIINIYNIIGELAATAVHKSFEAGYQSVDFNATGLPSGVYIYRIEAKGAGKTFIDSRKMLLLK